jgi:2-iminobutanoate/2-iminopropanoate deaminase
VPADREPIDAPDLAPAAGFYVHAVRTGDLLFCSGQIPLDPATGELAGDTPAEQLAQCLRNLEGVCAAAGATLADAVRLTLYLTDMGSFAEVNEAYAGFFPGGPPARVAIGVSALPRGAQVEVDAVVALAR